MTEPRPVLPERARLAVVGVAIALTLAFANYAIAAKERIVRDGKTMLVRLAPLDPRSLIQGDYMALRYALAGEVAVAAGQARVVDGRIVVRLDERPEAHFVRIDDGRPLDEAQHLLRFRRRGEAVRLASDAYFFEEGRAAHFASARYGELRVDGAGEAVLIGLRDAQASRLAD